VRTVLITAENLLKTKRVLLFTIYKAAGILLKTQLTGGNSFIKHNTIPLFLKKSLLTLTTLLITPIHL